MPVLTGSPSSFDEYFKPFIRGCQIASTLIATALVWAFAPIWAWPVPAVLIILVFEYVLTKRGNRFFRLHLNHHRPLTNNFHALFLSSYKY